MAGASKLITFRDGTVASLAVLERLWAIETRERCNERVFFVPWK